MSLSNNTLGCEIPSGLCISPDGNRVAYYTRSRSISNAVFAQSTSSLWVADSGKPGSARRITDGRYRDHSPRWSATGRYLYFLSNRTSGSQSKSCTLYYLDTLIAENVASVDTPETLEDRFMLSAEEHSKVLRGQVGDYRASRRGPLPVISTDHLRRYDNVAKFDVAYFGNRGQFAFLKGEPQDDSAAVVDDGVSWAHHTRVSRYDPTYVYYASLKQPGVDDGYFPYPRSCCYITDIAWSSDGSQVANVTRTSANLSLPHESDLWVESSFYQSEPKRVFSTPHEITGGLSWVGRHVYFQMRPVLDDATSVNAKAIYRVDIGDQSLLLRADQNLSNGPNLYINPTLAAAAAEIVARPGYGKPESERICEKVAGDEANCVRSFKTVRGPWSLTDENGNDISETDDILVHFQRDNEETLVLLRAGRTIYTTDKVIVDFAAASRKVRRGDVIVNETVLVVVEGSGDHANEVFSIAVPSGDRVQLSNHRSAMLVAMIKHLFVRG